MNSKAKFLIEKLKLIPHPEGGYFREIYRSDDIIKDGFLSERYSSHRVFSTSIYYLLVGNQISHFHRLKSDETWHFYSGSNLLIHCLDENVSYEQITIGSDFSENIFPQCTIKRGKWFAAEVSEKNSYSLIGCTVSPGFEYDDFELAQRNNLINLFPQNEEIITRFTKD